MASLEIFNIELNKMIAEMLVDYCFSCFGIFPVILSIFFEKYTISVFAFIATFIAVSDTSVSYNDNSFEVKNAFAAADMVSSILITLLCCFFIKLYKTCIGMFRTLWLVTLVSASSSYTFFKSLMNSNNLPIPNDISLIALSVSASLLVFSAIYVKCQKSTTTVSDDIWDQRLNLTIESLLICGAFILRFSEDIEKYIAFKVGKKTWHMCSWCALNLLCKK